MKIAQHVVDSAIIGEDKQEYREEIDREKSRGPVVGYETDPLMAMTGPEQGVVPHQKIFLIGMNALYASAKLRASLGQSLSR